MDGVKPRRYTSALRQEQAARTRVAVLTAARELFLEQGYGATTVEQVAARAGVSKPTVFTAVGNKQQLLKTVRDVAMAGDDDPVPVAERPSLQAAFDAPTAAEALRLFAAHAAALQRRYAGVDEVLRGAAAAGDPVLRELWRTSEDQRRTAAAMVVARLADKGPLRRGLTPGRAADVLSTYLAPDLYARLVHALGWDHDAYEQWLAVTLVEQLLDGSPRRDTLRSAQPAVPSTGSSRSAREFMQ